MLQHVNKKYRVLILPAMTTLIIAGCAGTPAVVKQGDQVDIRFTCRLPNNELVASTDRSANELSQLISPVFRKRSADDPLTITATDTVKTLGGQDRASFEEVIANMLAQHTVGMRTGEQRSIELVTSRYAGLPENEQFISIPRVRRFPREMKLSPAVYTGRTGKKPEIGQSFTIDPNIPGVVVEVSEKEIVVRFSARKGNQAETPFGNGIIQENDKEYTYAIEARKGALVRTAGIVGRIIDVSDDLIKLDFGHPFGGETLACNLAIVATTPAPEAAMTPAAAKPAPSSADTVKPPADFDTKIALIKQAIEKAAKNGESVVNIDLGAGSKSVQSAAPAQGGDLVKVHYTATLEDGSLFYTTRKELADDPALKKVSWFVAQPGNEPEEMVVGKPARLLPGISEALTGMSAGEKKRVTLTADKAFGPADAKKMVHFPVSRTLPKGVVMSAEEYVKRFTAFPSVGKDVPLTPYFPARVTAVRDKEVELAFQVEDGASFTEPFGTTIVKVSTDTVITTLKPVIGGAFPLQEGFGIITSTDNETFTVDSNHPLAGKGIVIDLELISLTKAGDLPHGELPWQEDHDAGLAKAKEAGKPAVLVLYADWCGYCKKFFGETLPDPRIASLRDRFAWIKVNSDKLTDYKKRYGQEGYPMIVLFRPDGSIARKLDGFQEPADFRTALQEVL